MDSTQINTKSAVGYTKSCLSFFVSSVDLEYLGRGELGGWVVILLVVKLSIYFVSLKGYTCIMTIMNTSSIARVAHEANKAYCESIGDNSQVSWGVAPQWQRDSAIAGVQAHLDNPDMTPEQSHESWLAVKEADGWVYGEVKDADNKTHPCCVPYGELPSKQQVKDKLFSSIVGALREPATVAG